MSVCEGSRRSVSERQSIPEEIFTQPIDQQYYAEPCSFMQNESEASEFFEEYSLDMKNLINSLDFVETSADCDLSLESCKSKETSDANCVLNLSSRLKENWRTSVEETRSSQKSFLVFLTSPQVPRGMPFGYRARAYSGSLPLSKFSNPDGCPFNSATSEPTNLLQGSGSIASNAKIHIKTSISSCFLNSNNN